MEEISRSHRVTLEQAIERLKNSKLVAIPTETVYGLGANAADADAVAHVFATKGRPTNHPLIVHCASLTHAKQFIEPVSESMESLMKAFWPGPLTVVTRKTDRVSEKVTGGRDTVAIRCPAHALTHQLLEASGLALVAPSANRFGRVSPTKAEHVLSEFPNNDVAVLDGGECTLGIESTIVREQEGVLEVMRVGALDIATLQAHWPGPVIYNHSTKGGVPGALAQHYAPEKGVWLWQPTQDFNFYETDTVYGWHQPPIACHFESLPADPVACGSVLYRTFRLADEGLPGRLVIEMPPDESRWFAVRDRLIRAARTEGS